MAYIAVGLQTKDETKIPTIIEIGRKFKYELLLDDFNLNDEVSEGLKSFCSTVRINNVLLINNPLHKKIKLSSDGIDSDLTNFFMTQTQSSFLNFIQEITQLASQSFYLIFADEWKYEDKIRLIDTNISLLKAFFLLNNSWYMWIYDYKNSVYQARYETPLIFLIDNYKKFLPL